MILAIPLMVFLCQEQITPYEYCLEQIFGIRLMGKIGYKVKITDLSLLDFQTNKLTAVQFAGVRVV